MPLLQVRDFPEDLYAKLSYVAQAENRSIAQETIFLLKQALNHKEEWQSRRKEVLLAIQNLKIKKTKNFPDPVVAIRQDRQR